MRVKLFSRILLICLLVVVTMVPINYIVDPALMLRDGEYERTVAEGILAKKYVGVNDNYNERRYQRMFIRGLYEKPDAILVGSSRSMLIPCDALGEGNILCGGVTGAVMEDIIGIIAMYAGRNMLPDKVFICLDPWLFNDNHWDTRYRELIPEYNSIAEQLRLRPIPETIQTQSWYMKIEQALSPAYFQESVRNIHHRPQKPIVTDEYNVDFFSRLPDGTIAYPSDYTSRTEDEVADDVLAVINSGYIYHSTGYMLLSPVIAAQFASVINYFESVGVTAVFILPPLHPMLYAYISDNPDYYVFAEAEEFIFTFAEQRGITVVGSFDPHAIGASGADFYDAYHPTREFMARLCKDFFAD